MKTIYFAIITLLLIITVSCKGEKKETSDGEKTEKVNPSEIEQQKEPETPIQLEIELSAKSDSNVTGKIEFSELNGMVTMIASMKGLSEGKHAIHIHEKADCSSPDGKSTGGHWNPTLKPHGAWGAKEGYHRGDIGNFNATADGTGNITFATNEWCIGCADEKKNIIGKAIIVHQGEDDLKSQPSGAAGSRVSCAGIIK